MRDKIESAIRDVEKGIQTLQAINSLKKRGLDTFVTAKELKELGVNVGTKHNRPICMKVNPVYETFELKTELYRGANISKKALENGSYKIIFDNGVVKTLDLALAKELGMEQSSSWYCEGTCYRVKDDYNVIIKAKRCYYLVSDIVNSLQEFIKCNTYYDSQWFVRDIVEARASLNTLEEKLRDFQEIKEA